MRLTGLGVLCGGPIKALYSESGFDGEMRALVELSASVLGRAGARVYSAHLAESFERVTITSEEVTERDYAWCAACDVYLALLPTDQGGRVHPSAGTAIELGWVSERRVPVVIAWDERHRDAYSHLIRGLGAVTRTVFLDLVRMRQDPELLVTAVEMSRELADARVAVEEGHAHRRPQ